MLSLIKRLRGAPPVSPEYDPAHDPAVSSVVAPPTVTWPIAGQPAPRVAMPCPNCRARVRKIVKLTVNFATPDHPMRHVRVLHCSECTCLFYENQNPPDYTEESMLGRGRMSFYLQQGAGISLITRPIARVRRPPGSVYLEVGCGFGFGLDYAIRARGWVGTGIDPAGLSAHGRDMLGVPIEVRYLADDEPAWNHTCDVVMSSETIEHVPSPAAFIATLRHALKPGGILVLTTPNADEIDESKSQGVLVPLLSPGLHLVFQNSVSLRRLLEQAGFGHIVIETDSVSLVAYASDEPFELESDPSVIRSAYRAHLEDRARQVDMHGDLFFAFAGRALLESVNDGDMARADRVAALLVDGARARFGLDLDANPAPPPGADRAPLESLAVTMPLNLASILYADGIRRIAGGTPRADVEDRFDGAAAAADALRRALGELAMEDGMSETLAWAARAEAMLCAAAAGSIETPARLASLPPAPPGGPEGRARADTIVERALSTAVNAGHVTLGRAIAARAGLQAAPWANLKPDAKPPLVSPTRRDALFCLAILDVDPDRGGDLERGRRRFACLRSILDRDGAADPGLYWQALRGELQGAELMDDDEGRLAILAPFVPSQLPPDIAGTGDRVARSRFVTLVNSGNLEAARARLAAVLAQRFVSDPVDAPLAPDERDALFCVGVLDVNGGGDLARARAAFARVRAQAAPSAAAPAPDLYWAAVRGEVQAVRLADGPAAADAHRRYLLDGMPPEAVPDDLRAAAEHAAAG